ncbi:NAD(P)/FAD-dependent oxidoreductase [Brevibacillus sp. SYSU BS000544]|uniref:NAD(P)/FAD-dependent oxidoreductase n=1 Tax=Brevibacillus sp. SYSU BS000544 TaxID=3416443 RepID=UPI003CE4EB70
MIDVLVVGAGPAGLSAAIAIAENGLSVQVVDEFYRPGGRLLGQLHQEPNGEWWNGLEEAAKLYERAVQLGVSLLCGVSVYDVQQGDDRWTISTSKGEIDTKTLLLATGASETPVPVPGWTLPGVMSIGAAQVMTNVQRVRVGERGVIAGVNILSVAIARELLLAGIKIDRMLLPSLSIVTESAARPMEVMKSMLRFAHLAPSPLIRFGSRLISGTWLEPLGIHFYPKNGVNMWGIPIQLRKAIVEIVGNSCVEGVRIADVTPSGEVIRGTEEIIPADFVCIAGGLSPLAELAAVAGCPFVYEPSLGGHIPLHNEQMQTPLKGLYVAGNITGIESAKVAIAQGTVAGLSISVENGKLSTNADELQKAIHGVKSVRRQATIQFHPDITEGRSRVAERFAANCNN